MNIENLEVYNLNSEKDGKKIFFDELLKDSFPNNQAIEKTLLATDMDGTMFKEDLGVLVFLEKLSNPKIWDRFDTKRLEALLLPKDYRITLEDGAKGTGWPELDKSTCQTILQIKTDIIKLYEQLKFIQNKDPHTTELTINHPLVNEFARKMIELDQQMIGLDQMFSKRLNGLFLMRTRFFTGLTNNSIQQFTKNVFNHNNPELILETHSENKKTADQAIDLDPISIHRIINTVQDVRKIITRFVVENQVKGKVITTNLQDIAEAAIRYSEYAYLEDSDFGVVGQKLLKRKNSTYKTRYLNKPVFGKRKEELANHVATKTERTLLCALGDSPSNDGPMLKRAIENGGFGVLVGEDFDKVIAKFEKFIKEVNQTSREDIARRIIIVETD